jgi:hypothetical protein
MSEVKRISIKAVLEDLHNGLTRFPEGTDYNEAVGCIQTKYSLDKNQVTEIFKHPKLKGRKTRKVKDPEFILVDDTEEIAVEHPVDLEEGIALGMQYGARPAIKQLAKVVSPPATPAAEETQKSEVEF